MSIDWSKRKTVIDIAQEEQNVLNELAEQKAKQYLEDTNFYVIDYIESAEIIPQAIKDKRAVAKTEQYGRRIRLITELFSQASVNRSTLSSEDEELVYGFEHGITVEEVLTGDYGIMPEGRMVYDVLNIDHSENNFSSVVSKHIQAVTYFDITSDMFCVVPF